MQIRVNPILDQPDYLIEIGSNILGSKLTEAKAKYANIIIVTDSNIDKLYLADLDLGISKVVLEPGEHLKSFENLEFLINEFSKAGLLRNSLVVAIGGGVIGDLVGFAASIYLRGVDYWQVPTSLVAMVDSSIGGKTGINTSFGKNLVGAFYHPAKIICDLEFLAKLPEFEVKNGLAESVKHALIADLSLIKELIENPISVASVGRSAEIKVNIITEDPFEKNKRKWLNVGHTFAHALEKASNMNIAHGVAVAKGIYFEAKLALSLNFISQECFNTVVKSLEDLKLDFELKEEINPELIWEIMLQDKKNTTADKVNFAIVMAPGKKVEILEVSYEQFLNFINAN